MTEIDLGICETLFDIVFTSLVFGLFWKHVAEIDRGMCEILFDIVFTSQVVSLPKTCFFDDVSVSAVGD